LKIIGLIFIRKVKILGHYARPAPPLQSTGFVRFFHLAFTAPSRSAVDEFHKAALLHGGEDNGAAGLRPDYGDEYYAAFVIDPDGYHIEAVINGAGQA
jgi:catechol 2,3-dioxygenase-like lactoylglutathione lyase family enzyme